MNVTVILRSLAGNTISQHEVWQLNQDELLERITLNPEILGGKPVIRGRRLAVDR